MKDISGTVFNIQKFSISDGPGIRTTVFLKGCPLRCAWCHNPESLDKAPEISFIAEKCIGCGYCFRACPHACHAMQNGKHVFDRSGCVRCGRCAKECYAQALEKVGQPMSVPEVMREVLKDVPFYRESGGGMTISGGEPMAQFEFTQNLLRAAKKEKISAAVETCGYAPVKAYDAILDCVDLFLYDCKETDPDKHKKFTGVDNGRIIKNLFALDKAGKTIILRCPVIPGFNDRPGHFAGIAALANRLQNISEINVLPYHPLGEDKSARIGKTYALSGKPFADSRDVKKWIGAISKLTGVPVRKA